MIISVPHSGTRALKDHLDTGPRKVLGRYVHFHERDGFGKKESEDHLDIPIRFPLDVAISWHARYYGTRAGQTNMSPEAMLLAFQRMYTYIAGGGTAYGFSLWRMEDLPRNQESEAPGMTFEVVREAKQGPYVLGVRRWVRDNRAVQNFYSQFYEVTWEHWLDLRYNLGTRSSFPFMFGPGAP